MCVANLTLHYVIVINDRMIVIIASASFKKSISDVDTKMNKDLGSMIECLHLLK